MKTIEQTISAKTTLSLCLRWQSGSGQEEQLNCPITEAAEQRFAHGGLRLHLRRHREGGQLILGGDIDSDAPLTIIDCSWRLEHARLQATGLRCWGLPFSAWGRPGIRPLSEVNSDDPCWWRCAIFADGDDCALAASWPLPASWQGSFIRDGESLIAHSHLDAELAAGDCLSLDELAIDCAAPLRQALAGPACFRSSRRRCDDSSRHMAWNSWDFHRLTISAAAIRTELAAICADPFLRERIRYIIIDDGWQDRCGDWQANERFPEGMAAICDEIRAAGFVPGIWSAPFLANCHSRIGREHPEYFVQKNDGPYSPWADKQCGPPWGERFHLDPTSPEVQQHIAELYQRLYGWGFRYFKTDFLANPLLSGYNNCIPDRGGELSYHKRGRGLLRAHRSCMQQIRAAIGEDSFWLGCGSIWSTGAGLMDASRMSGDISASWNAALRCAESVQWAGALHGTCWLNDPDFLVVRGPATSRGLMAEGEGADTFVMASHGHQPDFTLDEARVWATCVAMSGGHVVLSDSMVELNAAGREILHSVLDHCGGPAAQPIDIDKERPGLLLKEGTLACINWTDATGSACAEQWLDQLPDCVWKDVWSGRVFETQDLPSYELAARSCLLLTAQLS